MRIERERFGATLSSRPLDLGSTEVQAALRSAGIDPAELGPIGDGDSVIAGEAELLQLYDRLGELDRARPLDGTNPDGSRLERAMQLFRALSEDSRRAPQPALAQRQPQIGVGARRRETPEVAAPPVAPGDRVAPGSPGAPQLVQAGTTRVGEGRDAREVAAYVRVTPETTQRVQELRELPAPAVARGQRAHVPVAAYLDAIAARESGATARPANVPAGIWDLARALPMVGVTRADVEHYLAHGQLPDLVDAEGQVLRTGQQRFEALEHAAARQGSWPAVNTFTFLVGMRREVMAAERAQAETRLAAMPADDPQRAGLAAAIEQSRTADRELHRGLQGLYTAATYARERNGQAALQMAARYEQQAATARAAGDVPRAEQLEARARDARDRAARIAHSEATYRAGMRGTGWSAASTFQLAAQAQIERGGAEIRDLQRQTDAPPPEPPASLGMAQDAGNGVPGAGLLLQDARAASPTGGNDHRTLGLEGARQGQLAAFHRIHLDRGAYFAADTVRTPALEQHRVGYLEARASQADSAGARLQLYAAQPSNSAEDSLNATALASERRAALGEVEASLGRSMATDRQVRAARERHDAATSALTDARAAEADARGGVRDAGEGVTRARSQRAAVFGDTFKTSGEARRDDEGVSDAEVVSRMDDARLAFAIRRREGAEEVQRSAGEEARRLEDQARRDHRDADLARGVLARHRTLAPGGAGSIGQAYGSARAESDRLATAGARWLAAAEAQPPPNPAARRLFDLNVAGAHLDLAQYWTTSTELDAQARGDAGRAGATVRLDNAAGHLDRADGARTSLPASDPIRPQLAAGIIDARAALAEANADHRPGVSRDQLAAAERVMRSDLVVQAPEVAERARGRIGSAAVMSLVRHDQRFDQVLAGGHHVADADDALYAQAHRMLDRGRGGNAPEVRGARELLGRVDRSLDRVGDMLDASGAQLRNGQRYAEARTRAMGRSEIQAGQAQVSVVISGGAYLLSFGQYDMREEMADSGEHATRHRLGIGRQSTDEQVRGQEQLSAAWSQARREGRAFELIGSLRIFADRGNRERHPELYGAAFLFIQSRVPPAGPGREDDWQAFNRVAIRGDRDQPPASPIARALVGPVLGYEGAMRAVGDRSIGVITGDMRDMMQSQADSLQETTRNMGWIIAINTSLEVALGIVLTGGIGSVAAVGEAANAANAARTGVQAMNAVRTAGMLTRAGQALTAFRAAHPVLHTIGVTTSVGAGMIGVSHGARRLFGASSGASRFVDVAANFVPIGAGQRAAGLARAGDRALLAGGEEAVGAAARLRGAVSAERLIAHGRFYGPQVALGGGQAFVTTLAVPALADRLGVRSELGQAALGVALNTVMSGGVAGVMARRAPIRAQAEAVAPHLTEGLPSDAARTQRVRADVEAFMRRTEGRVPTEAEAGALRTQLHERLGIPETGGDAAVQARRARVDATIEAIRVDRAGQLGFAEARGRARGPVTEEQASRAVELTAQQLFEARGGERGGASRAQAYRDALEVTTRRLGEGAPDALVAAHRAATDRARAGELAHSFSVPAEPGGRPLIRSAEQRARVESILAQELGPMRQVIESGEGARLTDRSAGASRFERLSARLQREGGLSREGAESVLRAVQHDVVERGAVGRVAAEQARATEPLSEARIRELVAESAERGGMDHPNAQAAAGEVMARGGFVDWVRSQLPARHWTPDMRRHHLLETAHPDAAAELRTLNAAELNAVYGGAAIPRGGLDVVGRIPGFAAFARAHPAEARVLADSAILFGNVEAHVRADVAANGAQGFRNMAARYERMLPVISPHPTNPSYTIVTRGPDSPAWIPAYQLRPTQALDHNGAFHYGGTAQGRLGRGERRVTTPFADLVNVPRPGQMIVNGAPLANADRVLVFSGHGFWYSAGERTSRGSAMAADQIAASRARGQPIDYVVLDACHQRDRRWFFGGSNAEAFQTEVNVALQARGEAPVTVLAADRGGPTYGTSQRSWLPIHRDAGGVHLGYRYDPARYTPASDGARFYMTPMFGVLTAEALAGAGAGGYFVYRALSDRPQQQERPQPGDDRRGPQRP